MVLHPARRVAPSYDMHDHGPDFLCLLFGRLRHLPCSRWREIFRIHRLACCGLLSDARFARSPCVCDFAAGDFDPRSGLSSPMGQAQTDRTLDGPDLALCLRDGRIRLFDAIQMVSSRECDAASRAWQIDAATEILRSAMI